MDVENTKFEDKLKKLENIISLLESGNSSLEDSIDKYMEAMKLVKECDEKLKNIESQVSKIVLEDGSLKDFDIENDN